MKSVKVIKYSVICLWKLIVQVSVVLRKIAGGSDWRFDNLSGGHLLTLKMTAAQAVETSVTSTNSLSQGYNNLDDQLPQTCHDSPRFKPFTLKYSVYGTLRIIFFKYSKLDNPCSLSWFLSSLQNNQDFIDNNYLKWWKKFLKTLINEDIIVTPETFEIYHNNITMETFKELIREDLPSYFVF